jgi:hypothetical protein
MNFQIAPLIAAANLADQLPHGSRLRGQYNPSLLAGSRGYANGIRQMLHDEPVERANRKYITADVAVSHMLSQSAPKKLVAVDAGKISQINGNNGSATNTDDHASKKPAVKKLAQAIIKAEQKGRKNGDRRPIYGPKISPAFTGPGQIVPVRTANTNSTGQMLAPLAETIVIGPSISFRACKNKDGMSGLEVSGRQRLNAMFAGSATSLSFSASSVVSFLYMDPSALLNPLGGIAQQFQRYRFTRIDPFFRATLTASTSGACTFGYTSDAYAAVGSLTAASVTTLTNSVETAVWQSAELKTKLAHDNLYYTYGSGTGQADVRVANQGVIVLATGTVTGYTVGTAVGDMWFDYCVELYEPGANSVILRDPLEHHMRTALHYRLLIEKEKDSRLLDVKKVDALMAMENPTTAILPPKGWLSL